MTYTPTAEIHRRGVTDRLTYANSPTEVHPEQARK